MVVNNNGAFFNGKWTVNGGKLTGGTRQAQAFILLHELAHALGVTGFLDDYGKADNGAKNDSMIEQHCKKTVDQFK